MTEQVRFQYQKGIVTGGYSFSVGNNIITLPAYVEDIANARVREAIQHEAEKARRYYIEEVNRLKMLGEKVSTFYAKREATMKAIEETRAKYADIWDEVETAKKAVKLSETTKPKHETPQPNDLKTDSAPCHAKDTRFLVTVKGYGNTTQQIVCLVYEGEELSIKVL